MALTLPWRLEVIADSGEYKIWWSPVINHGHESPPEDDNYLPFRFLLWLSYWDNRPELPCRYLVEILAVSPFAVQRHGQLAAAAASVGLTEEELLADEENLYIDVARYGFRAPLWEEGGNNRRTLLRAARARLAEIHLLFGFWMDRAVNAIGATGWDLIKGEDFRVIAERTVRALRQHLGQPPAPGRAHADDPGGGGTGGG